MNPGIFNDDDRKHFRKLLRDKKTYIEIHKHFPQATMRQIQHMGVKLKKEMGIKVRTVNPKLIREPLYMIESKLDFTWMNIETGGM